jgi:hypothetical protein
MIDITRPFECPFCNFAGDAVIVPSTDIEDVWWIVCLHCMAQGPKKKTPEEAIRLWNIAPRRSDGLGKRT